MENNFSKDLRLPCKNIHKLGLWEELDHKVSVFNDRIKGCLFHIITFLPFDLWPSSDEDEGLW